MLIGDGTEGAGELGGNTAFVTAFVVSPLDMRELDIDLIDRINPF